MCIPYNRVKEVERDVINTHTHPSQPPRVMSSEYAPDSYVSLGCRMGGGGEGPAVSDILSSEEQAATALLPNVAEKMSILEASHVGAPSDPWSRVIDSICRPAFPLTPTRSIIECLLPLHTHPPPLFLQPTVWCPSRHLPFP